MNQSIFERLYVREDNEVISTRAEPFCTLLSDEVRQLDSDDDRAAETTNPRANEMGI